MIGSEFLGKYVIARCESAGCFAGVLTALEGSTAILRDCRRLWFWSGAASLSELAQRGTSKPGDCKFPASVDSILLIDQVIEILSVTSHAEASIKGVPVWTS